MTIDEAKQLLVIERECINRNNQPFGKNCDRNCGKCDLVQNTDKLIEMYDNVAEWLEELKAMRSLDKTNFSDGYSMAIDDCIDKFAEILSNIKEMCGRNCPVNCNWGTTTNCKDMCKKWLAEQLKGGNSNGK